MLFFAEFTGLDCGGEVILKIIKFVMTLLNLVFFLVPMILIVMVSIDFVKNVIASDEGVMKKNTQLILKRFIMCVALFLVDPVVNFSVKLLGNLGVDYAQCITIATDEEDLSQYKLDLFPATDDSSSTPNTVKKPDSGFSVIGGGSGNQSVKEVDATFLIGDSRFVGMKSAVDVGSDKVDYIAKTSQGYSWLKNTAIDTLNSKIKSGKKYNIVINLGVNDMGNIDNYLKLYNSMASNSKYKNCNITVVSVNPIDDAKASSNGYNAKNSEVQSFNKKMKSGLSSSIKYCDTYSKIKNNFGTNDGIHYNNNTYQKIYNEIKQCISTTEITDSEYTQTAENLLKAMNKFSKQVQKDYKNGKYWRYKWVGKDKTFEQARSSGRRQGTCVSIVLWGLREIGALKENMFYSYTSGTTLKSGNGGEKYLKQYATVTEISPRKTPKQLQGTENELKPGDIIGWDFNHMSIYAGDKKFYDAGRIGKNGCSKTLGAFKTFGPVSAGWTNKVKYIIRLKK